MRFPTPLLAGVLALVVSGCSIKRMAINGIGDSLTTGPSVFETDDDPLLVCGSLPFSIKFLEMLLAESPKHRGLLMSAAKAYTLEAYACVAQEAEYAGADLATTQAATLRARKLLLRAVGYGMRGLEVTMPGVTAGLARDPKSALGKATKADVGLLYWSAASLGLAISSGKGEASLLSRLPEVEALLARALALDESFDRGALHEFQLTFATSRPTGADAGTAKRAFDRALDLSGGKRASLFVARAESVAVPAQDRKGFVAALERALAVDPAAEPSLKLANALAQRRARWLLHRVDDLFLEEAPETPAEGATP